MSLYSRSFFVALFLVSCLLFLVSNVHAKGEFETDYNITYLIDQSGKTTVTQQITLRNKTESYYADKFELKIGSTKVENVKADDETGPLDVEAKFADNITTISVRFKQRVIGIDKKLPWNLSYQSTELASKSGQIWEVSIPRLAKSTEINSYQAVVKVPRTFGPAAFTSPNPKTKIETPSFQEFTFDKDSLIMSGIAMYFGEKQVFSFKLEYFLENQNVTTQIEEIALPPDNNYQKVVIENIKPLPIDVVVDDDGNFLAKYRLSSKQKISIVADGYIEVFSKPFRNIDKQLSPEQRKKYLSPQRYWETDNASIKNEATKLKNPKKIYEFVTDYLIYNEDRLNQPKIERKGAAASFNTPQEAVCMEFTDLFITLARAAGIPAREVEGYAHTQNERLRPLSLALTKGDILHAWPEYWDEEKGWIQIDPTWGSTSGGLDYFNKLDFNHITFVQRGISSVYPYPAGFYKSQEQYDQKSVFVSFAQTLPNPTISPELSLKSPDTIISGFPAKIIANIKNGGSTSIIGEKLSLSTNVLVNSSPNSQEISILPPFSQRSATFSLLTPDLFTSSQDTIILSFADTQISKPITVEPLYKIFTSKIFLEIVIVILLIVGLGLSLYKRTHKSKI